jgi:hypothetical protein
MVKRQAASGIENQKQQMVSAIFANPNWDNKENDRAGKLKELEASYNRAIELVYHPERAKEQEQEIDWDNPFWKAERRAQEKIAAFRKAHMGETRGPTLSKEQLEARAEARKSIDQLS